VDPGPNDWSRKPLPDRASLAGSVEGWYDLHSQRLVQPKDLGRFGLGTHSQLAALVASIVSNGAAGCGALWMRHMPAASALSSPDVASRWLGTAHHAQGVMRRTMPPGGRPTVRVFWCAHVCVAHSCRPAAALNLARQRRFASPSRRYCRRVD